MQIILSKLPSTELGRVIKIIMVELGDGSTTSPYSEWEIRNVLHGAPWDGIKYDASSTRNPLAAAPQAPPQMQPVQQSSICSRIHGLGNAEAIRQSQQQFAAWVNTEISETSEEIVATEGSGGQLQPVAKRKKTTPLAPSDINTNLVVEPVVPDKEFAEKPWFGRVIGLGAAQGKKPPTHAWVWFFGNKGYPDIENSLVPIKKLHTDLAPAKIPVFFKEENLEDWFAADPGAIQKARDFFFLQQGRRIAVQWGKNQIDNATVVKSKDTTVAIEYDDGTTDYITWDPIYNKKPWRYLHETLDGPDDMRVPETVDSDHSEIDMDAA